MGDRRETIDPSSDVFNDSFAEDSIQMDDRRDRRETIDPIDLANFLNSSSPETGEIPEETPHTVMSIGERPSGRPPLSPFPSGTRTRGRRKRRSQLAQETPQKKKRRVESPERTISSDPIQTPEEEKSAVVVLRRSPRLREKQAPKKKSPSPRKKTPSPKKASPPKENSLNVADLLPMPSPVKARTPQAVPESDDDLSGFMDTPSDQGEPMGGNATIMFTPSPDAAGRTATGNDTMQSIASLSDGSVLDLSDEDDDANATEGSIKFTPSPHMSLKASPSEKTASAESTESYSNLFNRLGISPGIVGLEDSLISSSDDSEVEGVISSSDDSEVEGVEASADSQQPAFSAEQMTFMLTPSSTANVSGLNQSSLLSSESDSLRLSFGPDSAPRLRDMKPQETEMSPSDQNGDTLILGQSLSEDQSSLVTVDTPETERRDEASFNDSSVMQEDSSLNDGSVMQEDSSLNDGSFAESASSFLPAEGSIAPPAQGEANDDDSVCTAEPKTNDDDSVCTVVAEPVSVLKGTGIEEETPADDTTAEEPPAAPRIPGIQGAYLLSGNSRRHTFGGEDVRPFSLSFAKAQPKADRVEVEEGEESSSPSSPEVQEVDSPEVQEVPPVYSSRENEDSSAIVSARIDQEFKIEREQLMKMLRETKERTLKAIELCRQGQETTLKDLASVEQEIKERVDLKNWHDSLLERNAEARETLAALELEQKQLSDQRMSKVETVSVNSAVGQWVSVVENGERRFEIPVLSGLVVELIAPLGQDVVQSVAVVLTREEGPDPLLPWGATALTPLLKRCGEVSVRQALAEIQVAGICLDGMLSYLRSIWWEHCPALTFSVSGDDESATLRIAVCSVQKRVLCSIEIAFASEGLQVLGCDRVCPFATLVEDRFSGETFAVSSHGMTDLLDRLLCVLEEVQRDEKEDIRDIAALFGCSL